MTTSARAPQVLGRARRRTVAGLALAALLLALVGCGPAAPPTDLHPVAAEELQERVLALSQAVVAKRYDAADAGLAQIRAALEAAVDDGQVSASRYRLIDDSLDRVAAELEAAREVLATEQEQVEAEALAAAEAEAAAQAEAEAAAQAEAEASGGGTVSQPAQPPTSGSDDNPNRGRGNNSGKGNR